jgi:hypothetical protein
MTAQEGQSVFDACMQGYGSLEYLFMFLKDNNLTVNSALGAGQELIIDDTIGNIKIKEYIITNNIVLNNRTYETDIEVVEEIGIQWPVFVDPAEIIYPYKLIVP